MTRFRLGSALLLVLLLQAGCARALGKLPPLTDLGGQTEPADPAQVDVLLAEAARFYAERTLERVEQARHLWIQGAKADSGRIEGLTGVCRASVWLAEHADSAEARLPAAELAVQAARWCGRIDPEAPDCPYWLGAGLGLQAREKPSTGLDALPRIVAAFRRAASLDPFLELGGPDRALALVYLRAPGWPTGPGDPDLGVEHARRAVELAPGYPPNHLALGEGLEAVGEPDAGRAAYERALELARRSAGDPDAPDWIRNAEEALASGRR